MDFTQPDRNRRMTHGLILSLLAAIIVQNGSTAAPPSSKEEARWKLRLSEEDRSAVESNLGHALPRFPEDVVWLGASPFEGKTGVEGRVVVVQSWSHGNSRGRAVPRKLEKSLKSIEGADDLVVVLLHTPENADKAAAFMERSGSSYPVMLDASGRTCDAMGIYRRPVNLVVDRQGVIRYAGLHDRGLKSAVQKLLAEPRDASVTPKPHPADTVEAKTTAGEFPTFDNAVRSATDLRGQRAPEFVVDRWLTPEPAAQGKVAVVDFWATWCGPCVRSIPHMNELADQFRGQVEFVGVSNESLADFNRGLSDRKLSPQSFRYSLALDPKSRMMSGFGVRGIPHVAVMSSDWVVRWQGSPGGLTSDVLRGIVAANGGGRDAVAGLPPARWNASDR